MSLNPGHIHPGFHGICLTSATKNGVLIKGREYVEEMQNIDLMVFDKTGTITLGELGITDIISINNYSRDEILQIAASLESRSKHPVAEPILNEALKENYLLKMWKISVP